MDRQQARRIIQETFEKPFDKNRFTHFIKNLLNRIEEAPFAYHGQFIPEAYRQYISTLDRIGKYHDGENRIDILIIRLQKETSIERARTMQRNFVAGYLQGKYGSSKDKEAALVAFVTPDDMDWRFSLVKMDYKFEQTPTGKTKVKEEFTPARRWSFLVGVNEKSHTAQSRLEKILADDENNPTLAQLEDAFNIETVTKEFFLKYRDLFIRTKEALDRVVNNDAKIKADFEAKGVNAVDFAKKLLGQIVFLYFLQKKGWFGVARDADWGAGSKQFLRELFEKKHGDYHNFFNDVLEPLFYEALRNDRSHDYDYYSRFNCKIPFLNGGLFDPIGNYDWVHTDIYLPNVLFSNRKTSDDEGSGILDIFDLYNFTVKEDEPLEKEVAIDPELLGKAYEKFNAIRPDNFEEYKKALKSGRKGDESKFNKQFGVYYTPREIVHYMCQQSLINYLFTELNSGTTSYEKLGDSNLDMLGNEVKKGQLDITIKHRENPEIPKEDIETLIHLGEQVHENEARVLSKGKETKTYYHQLPESIRNNAKLVDQKLEAITVCDPAVGSGAFPVGMMSEIVKARNVLSIYYNSGLKPAVEPAVEPAVVESIPAKPAVNQPDLEDMPAMPIAVYDTAKEHSIYDLKRRCIEHSLYGVDIDPGAVEIAKLRLWLSLVVDEDDIKNIKPLPNLDYKIVCGNSLLGVEKNLFNNQFFIDLEKLKPLYFNETNPTKKQDYKKQIDDLISRITNGHKEFDFEIYFSEVFHEKTIEKNWKAYHITWVTHGSRISERMVELGVRTGDPVVLDEASKLVIADALAEKIREKQYRVLALNVLVDHVHCIVVCEEDDVEDIVQQLKGYSSHQHNRQLQLSVQGEGRQTKLWAKGSSQTLLESEEHLLNAIEYVQNNHIKHEVSEIGSSTHNRQLKRSVMRVDQAFTPITNSGGFDVVIANPPYVRQEAIRHLKPDLAKVFGDFFCGTADIYTYFYKRGIDLLKPVGHLCFIAPNKFMRAGYGKNTRVLLTTQVTPKLLIDFGDLPIFDATTYPSIILVEKRRPDSQDKASVATFMEADQLGRLRETLDQISFPMPVVSLKKEGWNLERPEVLALMEKLRKAGKPLGEYVQGRFYRGILTGLNEAFVIDAATRKRLIAEDPASAELIKPWLRGRDIRKWKAQWAGLYLINIPSSANRHWLWSDAKSETEAARLFEHAYPAISRHLSQWKKQLQKRDDQGKFWWELRSCAYYEAFEKPTITWGNLATEPKFAFDSTASYVSAPANVIPTHDLYLLAILNTPLCKWWISHKAAVRAGGFLEYKPMYVAELPVLPATDSQKAPIIEHTRAILADPDSPAVPQIEDEIDELVYKLYGLTVDDIGIVEG